MPFIEELDAQEELRGVVCPTCGGSLACRKGRAWCYEDGYVQPTKERLVGMLTMTDEEAQWLREHREDVPELID